MYILALLVFMFLQGTHALRPSHRAPVIFVITASTASNYTRGTSIRTDGTYAFGSISEDMKTRIHDVFPMATVLVVNTDDEARNYHQIGEWMYRECFVVQRRLKDDCFVISNVNYPPLKSALDPYEFRKWESSIKKVVRHALEPIHVESLGTARPTSRITASPVVPDRCEARAQIDCMGECRWYGVYHGCRTGAFCGFTTKFACEHRPECVMVRNRCRRREGSHNPPR